MATKYKAPLGATFIVISSLFYASYGIWTTLMGNFFDGYVASALRSVLVLVLLLPITLLYKQFEPLRLKKNWPYIAGMLTAALFTWGPLYYAILHAGVGISLAIQYASIVLGMFFFGWLFSAEKFTKDKAVSTVLGIGGLALIFSPSIQNIGLLALLGALVSGLAGALNSVCAKGIHYKATQSTIVMWVTSVVGNTAMAIVLGRALPDFGWHVQWLYLLLFAVASIIASWLFVHGTKLVEAGAAGILGLLEIVFGVLFGVIFFSERPGAVVLLGVVVVIAAASIPYIKDFTAHYRKPH